MAVTVTDHRTILNEADATTGWANSPTLFTADPDPAELTGCLGWAVSTATVDAFVTIAATNFVDKLVYVWAFPRGAMDTKANGGVAILIGDATPDRVGYHVGGSDLAGYRHNEGPARWENYVIDQGNLPTQKTVRAGLEANLDFANVTQVGVMFKTLAKSVGGVPNCFVDILRLLDLTLNNGAAMSITGGTSGDKGTWGQIAVADRSTADLKAHGLVRELGPGAYGVQGPLRFGNAAGTDSSWFEDTDATVIFESRGLATDVYLIFITDNGTGTTTFRLGKKVGAGTTATGESGVSIVAASVVGWQFDAATDADVTDVFIYGSTFRGATGGVKLRAGHEFIGGVIADSGLVDTGGATMVNTSIVGSTVAADASAIRWDAATDPDGKLDGCTLAKGAAAHHAIEFGVNSPLTMTLRDVTFTGFNAANGATDSALHIKRTTGTVTINVIGGTTPSYKTDGATVDIVANPVSATVKTVTTGGTAITSARVLLQADTGGPFPVNASVSITRSGATSTVTHTAHGLATNDKVLINGANEIEYNGVFAITVVDANTYTYTVSGSPATPATGAPTSTFVVLSGLTDVNGEITMSRVFPSAQPVTGRARKSSATPFYRTADIVGTVSASAGFSVTTPMILDE